MEQIKIPDRNLRFKFRIWDLENKCWMIQRSSNPDDPNWGWIPSKECEQQAYPMNQEWFIERPQFWRVQQSTGVIDRFGKLIYEGDIVKITDKNIGVMLAGSPAYSSGEITWLCEAWKVCQENIGATHLGDFVHCDCCYQQIEVINNIMEGPKSFLENVG